MLSPLTLSQASRSPQQATAAHESAKAELEILMIYHAGVQAYCSSSRCAR
jgi:hypothetical protein